MAVVECAFQNCRRPIVLDGVGGVLKKVVEDKNGDRLTVFFCCYNHLKWDGREDLNEPDKVIRLQFGSR